MNLYRHIPTMGSVFRVTEGCCYEQVIYDGPQIDVKFVKDEPGLAINSDYLSCACDLRLRIDQITEQFFLLKRDEVNERRINLKN